jgi:hypothetical protein
MRHLWKKSVLAAALAFAGAHAGANTVWSLDNTSSSGNTEGLTYTLTGDEATGSFNLLIEGINVAGVDTRGGRTFLEDLSFSPPTGYSGAQLGAIAAGPGGLNSSGCNGHGNFFCFDGVHEAVSGSTMSLDFTISATSFDDWAPHLKVDWIGSARNYDLVSKDMVGDPTPPVPEPETYAMLLAGLGAMGFLARRRQAKQGA